MGGLILRCLAQKYGATSDPGQIFRSATGHTLAALVSQEGAARARATALLQAGVDAVRVCWVLDRAGGDLQAHVDVRALRADGRWFGLVVTVVHELGHALAGLTTGRRVLRIRIEADHSGVTHTFGTSASAVWSTFWGYPFPAVVGAVWAAGAGAGRWPLVAAASAAVLVISLIVMRGWLSWCVTLGAAAAMIGDSSNPNTG